MDYRTLLRVLRQLRRMARHPRWLWWTGLFGPPMPRSGICVNVDSLLSVVDPSPGDNRSNLELIARLGLLYGQDESATPDPYFLPGGRDAYRSNRDHMWDPRHPYGRTRLEALDIIISRLEEKLCTTS